MTGYYSKKLGKWQYMITPPEMVAEKQAAEKKLKAGKPLTPEMSALKARMKAEAGEQYNDKEIWE